MAASGCTALARRTGFRAALSAALVGQLLDLLLQFVGRPAQHFLLPALFRTLPGICAALRAKLALPARQLVQLPQGRLDIRRMLGVGEGRLRALVLVLLRIELQVEQARQIPARRVDACGAAATARKRNFDLAEGRLRAQQVLKCLLLIGDRGTPLLAGEFLGRRTHRGRGGAHLPLETAELLVRELQIAHSQAARERRGLSAQCGLDIGEKLRLLRRLLRRCIPESVLLPGCSDDLLLALRDLRLVIGRSAACACAARLLRLREFTLKGVDLNERDVRVRLAAPVLRRRIHRDDVARSELQGLQRDQGRSVCAPGALLPHQIERLLRAPVHGIVQREFAQAEGIVRLRGQGDFLDRACAVIPFRAQQRHFRRLHRACFDEIVVGDAHSPIPFQRVDVIGAVLVHLHCAAVGVARLRGERDAPAIVY